VVGVYFGAVRVAGAPLTDEGAATGIDDYYLAGLGGTVYSSDEWHEGTF
jgi:hypothetical protein